jgi:hypothetical protein
VDTGKYLQTSDGKSWEEVIHPKETSSPQRRKKRHGVQAALSRRRKLAVVVLLTLALWILVITLLGLLGSVIWWISFG